MVEIAKDCWKTDFNCLPQRDGRWIWDGGRDRDGSMDMGADEQFPRVDGQPKLRAKIAQHRRAERDVIVADGRTGGIVQLPRDVPNQNGNGADIVVAAKEEIIALGAVDHFKEETDVIGIGFENITADLDGDAALAGRKPVIAHIRSAVGVRLRIVVDIKPANLDAFADSVVELKRSVIDGRDCPFERNVAEFSVGGKDKAG